MEKTKRISGGEDERDVYQNLCKVDEQWALCCDKELEVTQFWVTKLPSAQIQAFNT